MKRSLFIAFLVVTLIVCLALIGCTPSEPVEKDENGEAAPDEVFSLKWVDEHATTAWEAKMAAIPFLEDIERAGGGAIEVDPYWANTLLETADIWPGIAAGTADFGWCFMGVYGGMTTLADVVTLPFMPFESAEHGSAVLWTLYEEFPNLAKQFDENHIFLVWTSDPYILGTTKKQVVTMDDIKGLKIRAMGGPPTEMCDLLGAIPTSVPMPDAYTNLETGVLDGIFTPWEAIISWRFHEVLKYVTTIPAHCVYFTIPFNHAKWNSLPADVKSALEEVGGMKGSRFWGKQKFDTAPEEVLRMCDEEGIELVFHDPTPEELAVWREAVAPLWDNWVKAREEDGFDEAQEILDRCIELAEAGLAGI